MNLQLVKMGLTRIGQHGFFAGLFGLPHRFGIVQVVIHLQLVKHQVISDIFDLVEDTTLVRHPTKMLSVTSRIIWQIFPA